MATVVFGGPSQACIRRKNAARALWLAYKLRAARKARAGRSLPGRTRHGCTLPPEILCCGHSPSQAQKCWAVGRRLTSGPTALTSTSTKRVFGS